MSGQEKRHASIISYPRFQIKVKAEEKTTRFIVDYGLNVQMLILFEEKSNISN